MSKQTPGAAGQEAGDTRLPYAPPEIQVVELSVSETLSSGCKLGADAGCVGPPVTAFEGGS